MQETVGLTTDAQLSEKLPRKKLQFHYDAGAMRFETKEDIEFLCLAWYMLWMK